MEQENETSPEKLVARDPSVIDNPWSELERFTPARIGLGRTGHSLPTRPHLEFQLAHARAREAVYSRFEPDKLAEKVREMGLEALQVHSQAQDRIAFLRRPDLGRRLDLGSRRLLGEKGQPGEEGYQVVFVLGDGLSAQAIHRHALPVLGLVVHELAREDWRVGPVVIASEARVALGDEIGELSGAEQVAILIGERPGLSAPDSMGIYLTYAPEVGRLESDRNCISNIRPEGLTYTEAATTLVYLLREAKRLGYSGVRLKDEREI